MKFVLMSIFLGMTIGFVIYYFWMSKITGMNPILANLIFAIVISILLLSGYFLVLNSDKKLIALLLIFSLAAITSVGSIYIKIKQMEELNTNDEKKAKDIEQNESLK